ncbi:uncharacterized protein PF3D7_1120600-like [Periplaneta americana]|uniref:uncharacterized protein PF3D7_1120600-like n=1 Tax=Periplaneta americana TaxID=6978 RepID=UPI0037E9B2D9
MAGKKDKNCSEVDPNELLDWANETLMKLKLDKNALKNNKSNKAKRKSDSSSQFKSNDATTYISEKVTHLKKTKKIKHITVKRNPLNERSRINTQNSDGSHKLKKSKHRSKKVLHEENHDSTYEKKRDSSCVNGSYISYPHHCAYNKKEIKRHQETNVNDVKLTVDELMAADSRERKRTKSGSKERKRICTNEENYSVNTGHTDFKLENGSLIDNSNECEKVPKERKKCHEISFSSDINDKREIKLKKDRKHKYVSSDLAVNDGIEVMSQKKKYKSINKYEKKESYLILKEDVHNSSKQHKKETKPKYDRQEDNLEDNIRDEKRLSSSVLQKDVHNCDRQHKKKSKQDIQEARVGDSARDKNKELNLILQEDVHNGDEQRKRKKKPKYDRQEDRVEDTARDEYKESYLIPQEDVHNGDKQHRKKKKPKYDRQEDRVEDRNENKESYLIQQEDVHNGDKQLKKKKKPKYDRQNDGVEDDNKTSDKLSLYDIYNSNMQFEGQEILKSDDFHEKKKRKKYKHSYSTHSENEEHHKNFDMHKTEFVSEQDKQLLDKDEETILKHKKQKRKRKDRDPIPDESVCDKECSEFTNHDSEVIPKKKRIVTDIGCNNSDKRHKKRHKSETELSSLKTNENQEDRNIRSKLEEENSTNSLRMLKAKKKKKEKHKDSEMCMPENGTLLCTTEINSMKLNEDQEDQNIRSKIEEESSTNSLRNLKTKKNKKKHNDNEMSMTENETLPCTSGHKKKKYKDKSKIDNIESASEKNNISYNEETLTITTVMPQKKNHKHANVENNLVNDDETMHERISENLTDSHNRQIKLRPISKTNFGLSPIARILFAETECCHAEHNCQKYRKTAYVYTSESEDSDSDITSTFIKSEPEEIVIKEEIEEQDLQILGEVTIKQEIIEDEYIAPHTQDSQHLFEVSRAQQSVEHVNKVDIINTSVDGIIHRMTECMNMDEKKTQSCLPNNCLSVRTAAEINSRLEMSNNPADTNDIIIRMYGTPVGNNTFNNVHNLNENEDVIHIENNCHSNAMNNDHVLCSDFSFVRENTIRVLNNTDASGSHIESSVNEVSNLENPSVKSSVNEYNYKFSDNNPENPSLKSFDENNYRFSDNNPENSSIKSSVNENDYKFSDNKQENSSIQSSVNERKSKFSDSNRPENEFPINFNGEVDTNIHYNEWSNSNTETDVTFYNEYDHKFTIEEVLPQFQERNNCEDGYRNCTRSAFDANLSVMNNNAMQGMCIENTEKMHESPLLKFDSRHGITNVQSEGNSMFGNNGYNNMQVCSGSTPSFNIENGIIHQGSSAQHTNTKNWSEIIASNPCEYLFQDKTICRARGIVKFLRISKGINKDEVASRLCIPKKQIYIKRQGRYAHLSVRFFHLQQLQIIKENATKLRSSRCCVVIQILRSTDQHMKKITFRL